jgi:hypothetical protein
MVLAGHHGSVSRMSTQVTSYRFWQKKENELLQRYVKIPEKVRGITKN